MDTTESPYRAKLKTFTVVRVAESPVIPTSPITTPAGAAEYLLPFFRAADAGREHFAVLFLDGRHRPLAAKILFSGTINQAAIYPREIARAALLIGATALVVAHNHPSGDTSASAEDRQLTRRVDEALKTLDIRLLDSLVLSVEDGRFFAINKT